MTNLQIMSVSKAILLLGQQIQSVNVIDILFP